MGHSGGITSLVGNTISQQNDGAEVIFASTSNDKSVRIWNSIGDCLMTLEGHQNTVTACAFSPKPSDNVVATCSHDGTIKIWDIDNAVERSDFSSVNQVQFTSLAWHRKGRKIFSGTAGGKVMVWDYESGGKLLYSFKAHDNEISSLFLINKILVTTSYKTSPVGRGCYRFWTHKGEPIQSRVGDLLACTYLHDKQGEDDWECACLVRHSSMRVSLCHVPVVAYANPESHNLFSKEVNISEAHGYDITSAVIQDPFVEKGLVACGTAYGGVKFFSALNGARRYMVNGHTGAVSGIDILSNQNIVISACEGGVIRLWNARRQATTTSKTDNESNVLASPIASLSFASHLVHFKSRKILFSTCEDGTMELLDGDTGASISRVNHSSVREARLCPDGLRAVAAANALSAYKFPGNFEASSEWGKAVRVPSGLIESWDVGGHIHGGYILLVEHEKTLQVHAIRTGMPLAKKNFEFPILFVAMSPCGIFAACYLSNRTIHIWNIFSSVSTGGEGMVTSIRSPRGAGAVPKTLKFSPSGDYLLCYGDSPSFGLVLRLHETMQTTTVQTNAGLVNDATWSPDGRYLAIAGSLGATLIYRVGKIPEVVARINLADHHMEPHIKMAFSPTLDLRLFCLSENQIVQCWRPENLEATAWDEQRLILECMFFLEQPATSISIDNTGTRLAAGDIFGNINLFKIANISPVPIVTPFWGCRLREPAKIEDLVVRCPGCGRIHVVLSTLNALISEMQITRRKQNSMYALKKLDWHYVDRRLRYRCGGCDTLFSMAPHIFDVPMVSSYVTLNQDMEFNCDAFVALRVIEPLSKSIIVEGELKARGKPFETGASNGKSVKKCPTPGRRTEKTVEFRMQKSVSLPVLSEPHAAPVQSNVTKSPTRKRRPLPVVRQVSGQDFRSEEHLRSSLTRAKRGVATYN